MTQKEQTSDDPATGGAPRVAGLLLAAGGGRRLGGRPKALLRHGGRPLVEHAARVLREGGCGPVYVVLGAAGEQVRRTALLPGCVLVDNPDWSEGMGSSLRAGLQALSGAQAARGVEAAVVCLVDQPGIGAEAVARVRTAYRSLGSLASAAYDGRRGHPVLLGAAHWEGVVRSARADAGARDYLRERQDELALIECADIADPADIDTPDDLHRLG
ncbi:nucleotidyltransferase family protein [Streptomyces sp. A73]|uniref:nucleotidyltransferase family protein n=1 Tax=Streptomyces sp. RK75 TaxID=2824895 RepID=UPI001B38C247|nr:nucleotidyltransferase family protein [Streptomyces sp. RK75]MBQ0863998.1 nucleotidyltransferase family protein [Streptomyces sp. RK75]MBQ1159422.1 nucleotidyltransferase family protein [Streptomyces sp. A73]